MMAAAPNSFSSMQFSTPLLGALVGLVILFFGRKLFWLCVAAIGFAAGVEIAPLLIQHPSPWLALTFALVLGFVGALLAIFFQKIAIGIAGFIAGGRLAIAIAATIAFSYGQYYWLIFLVGGIVGAILLLVLFDWALIFLSAVLGAYLIEGITALPPGGSAVLFIVLVVIGVLVQGTALRRHRGPVSS